MIDAHIHLQDKRFDADRGDLIKRAQDKGVTAFFCAATRPRDIEQVIGLAQRHACIIPFIGTHPWFADEYDPEAFDSLLQRYPFAGVGEIGLDTLHGKENQEAVFQDQFNAAARLNRPYPETGKKTAAGFVVSRIFGNKAASGFPDAL